MSDLITDAEWEVMRVVWTLKETSSTKIVKILSNKTDWSYSTIKTLIRRLVKKGALQISSKGRTYLYKATISEQSAMNNALFDLFSHLCHKKSGKALLNLIQRIDLSKQDIISLQKILDDKLKVAPEELVCNCLSNCCDD